MVERDTWPCGPATLVEKVKVWRKVTEINVSVHFLFSYIQVVEAGEEREARSLLSNYIILETLMWEECFNDDA